MTAVVSIAEMLMRVTVLAVIVRRLVLKRAVHMVMPASKRRMQRRRRPDLRKHGPQLAADLLQQLRRHPGRGKPLLSTRVLRPANQLTLPAASITPGLPRCTIRFRQSTGYFQRIGPAVNPAVQRPERRGFSCRPLIAAAPSRSHLARERAARANFG